MNNDWVNPLTTQVVKCFLLGILLRAKTCCWLRLSSSSLLTWWSNLALHIYWHFAGFWGRGKKVFSMMPLALDDFSIPLDLNLSAPIRLLDLICLWLWLLISLCSWVLRSYRLLKGKEKITLVVIYYQWKPSPFLDIPRPLFPTLPSLGLCGVFLALLMTCINLAFYGRIVLYIKTMSLK